MLTQWGDVRARRAAIGDALVQHDRGVGAVAAGEVRDRRDEGVHEAARLKAVCAPGLPFLAQQRWANPQGRLDALIFC